MAITQSDESIMAGLRCNKAGCQCYVVSHNCLPPNQLVCFGSGPWPSRDVAWHHIWLCRTCSLRPVRREASGRITSASWRRRL